MNSLISLKLPIRVGMVVLTAFAVGLVAYALVDGFDFPVGAPDGSGYSVSGWNWIQCTDPMMMGACPGSFPYHPGEDWNGTSGGPNDDFDDPVYAIADGVVIDATDYGSSWGNIVLVEHDLVGEEKMWSQYAHLEDMDVSINDPVTRGDVIGSIGDADGYYAAAHLHFEMRHVYRDADDWVTGWTTAQIEDYYLEPTVFIDDSRPLGSLSATNVSGNITTNTTWSTGNIYKVTGNVVIDSGVTVTVEPGAVVKFNGDYRISVVGTLDVNGTPGNPAFFTSVKDDIGGDTNGDGGATSPAAGDWREILITSAGAANLDYAVVRYGGNCVAGAGCANVYNNGGDLAIVGSTTTDSEKYAIRQATSGSVGTVSNSEIADNGHNSVYLQDGTFSVSGSSVSNSTFSGIQADSGVDSLTISGNTFTDNATRAVSMAANVPLTDSANAGSGNAINGIYLTGTVASASVTWDGAGSEFPYVIGGVVVDSGRTLTIGAGVVVKFDNDKRLSVNATLEVDGTSGNEVYFTSLKDDTVGGDTNDDSSATSAALGDWRDMYITSIGTANFDYAVVRYGGNCLGGYTCANIYNTGGDLTFINSTSAGSDYFGIRQATSGATAVVTDSEVINNGGQGIYVQDGDVAISQSEVDGNATSGIVADAGADTVTVNDGSVTGNGSYGISSAVAINAEDTWWGESCGPTNATTNPSCDPGGDQVTDNVDWDPPLSSDPF